jgi:hypothetical protein
MIETQPDAGRKLVSTGRRSGTMTTAATNKNTVTKQGGNRPDADGDIAANNTATKQRKMISLRAEDMLTTCSIIHFASACLGLLVPLCH